MILDGATTSEQLIENLANEISSKELKLTIAIIQVGDNPASSIYVRNKQRACKKANINSILYKFPENATQKEIIQAVHDCNQDPEVTSIMVQLPLPKHIDEQAIINEIDYKKDVDGLTIHSQGLLFNDCEGIVPATPKGVITLLKKYNITINGKNAVVIGRSKLVGKPLAMLLLKNNATVTLAHSKTQNLKEITKKADILVVAVGKHNFITVDMVSKGAVVIDVGINRVNGLVKGDVDFENVSKIAEYITPVPKGVGPMTIASLLENIYLCYNLQNE